MTAGRLLNILHIDDDDSIREIVKLALERLGGFVVRSVSSGEEALEAVKTSVPDLVLLDVMMPGMDGPATLTRLRENPRTNDVAVVFLTAKAMRRDLAELEPLGVDGVIGKPFRARELVDTLLEIWDQRRNRQDA